MDVEIAEKSLGNKRMYNRSGTVGRSQQVCIFWQEGRCNREVCNFLHVGEAGTVKRGGTSNGFGPKRSYHSSDDRDIQGAGPPGAPRRNISARWGRGRGGRILTDERHKVRDKVCNFWLAGNCKHGEDCKFLHSYTVGADITFLTQLAGHEKAVRVRVWDCQTGQCISNIKLSGEIGCLLNEGPWLFVGLPNAVKGWNIQTSAELNLDGPRGQVHALVVGNGMLLAGVQDGNILAWKFSPAANSFEPTASLAGHTLAVVTLVAGADRLYSGSMDQTIRGVLALCGMHDEQAKPVLLCSCNDNSVRLYDLPSFSERGKGDEGNSVGRWHYRGHGCSGGACAKLQPEKVVAGYE